jgi:hypothetical protein
LEILARLEAKTSTWGDTGGSHDPLTAAMISASLAGADPVGLLVLRWRVGHKIPSSGYWMLLTAISGIASKEGWKVPKKDIGKERTIRLMEVCLDDYALPVRCPVCHGTGENELHKDCTKCEGTGNKNRSNNSRAKQIGVHRSTFMRSWKPKYHVIMNYFMDTLHEHEYLASKEIKKKLNNA